MSSYYWIKLYDDILDDPKMGRLSDGAFRLCINLFLLAGRGNPRNGELPPFDDTAWVLRLGQEEFTSQWGELERAGIVGIIDGCPRVLNFEKRQGALTPAEKQKLYRDRKRGEALQDSDHSVTTGVTKGNADIDTDIDIETDKDTEKSGSSSYANICRIYENEIGMLSLRVSEYLQEAVEEYSPQWIEDAIGEAVQHNARNWKYVAAILKRWKADGRANNTPSKNGHAQRNEDGSYYF